MSESNDRSKHMKFTRKKIESYSYGLNDEIGRGYSSKVYRGRNDNNDQNVAVKVIDLKMLKNQINRTLLESEIDILKSLRNLPNILNLYDVYTTKNNTYIITQLCQTDLSKYIKRQLTQPQVYTLMGQLIDGYMQFQKRGIIHRDLKPANLLLTTNQQLKIADFGFGVLAAYVSKHNKYNVGSPLYMAPESLKRNQYSHKSDLWSIGIIFFEMLTNSTPWAAKNQKELIKKIQSQPIQTIVANKKISSFSKEFLCQILRFQKNQRMSPEELQRFDFKKVQQNNILNQKIFNFKVTSSPGRKFEGCKTQSFGFSFQADKAIIKKTLIKKHHQENQQQDDQIYVQKSQTKIEKDISVNPATFRPIIDTKQNKCKHKQQTHLISKILISQIHFCRFLYKLIQKMKNSQLIKLLSQYERVIENYTGIIRKKIEDVCNFNQINYINCKNYNEYNKSGDCNKMMKVAKQYKQRYQRQLVAYWNIETSINPKYSTALIQAIYQTLNLQFKRLKCPQNDIAVYSQEIIILDYLVTTYQLFQMIKNDPNNYQRFYRKSRIQEIVQGKTAKINLQLFNKIMERVKVMIYKNQVVSFGDEANLIDPIR